MGPAGWVSGRGWPISRGRVGALQVVTIRHVGVLLKGEVLGSSNVKRTNNLPVDVEEFHPTVKG